MPATPVYALRYPQATDPADVPADMQKLAADVEASLGGQSLYGQYPSRPAANAVKPGTLYAAWDVGALFRSDGAAWAMIAQTGVARLVPGNLDLAPWNNPWEGARIRLTVDDPGGVEWDFVARLGVTYKWEFLGGPPMRVFASSQADMPGGAWGYAGPTIYAPRAGEYDLEASVFVWANTGAGVVYAMGPHLTTSAPPNATNASAGGNYAAIPPASLRQYALSAGAGLGVWGHGGGSMLNREVTLLPRRIN